LTFYFIVGHIVGYSIKGIPDYFGATLLNAKIWFYLHMAGGAMAILLGPLQFWKAFRIRYMQLHRTLGKIYIIGSIVSTLCMVRIFPEFGWTPMMPSLILVTTLWFFVNHCSLVDHQAKKYQSVSAIYGSQLLLCFLFCSSTNN
jgi:uncharacterized membrane protein